MTTVVPGTLTDYPSVMPALLSRATAFADGRLDAGSSDAPADDLPVTSQALIDAGAFAFRALRAEFEAALARRPDEIERFHRRIAGLSVEFRIAGRAMAEQIAECLGHLPSDPPAVGMPDVTVDAWDERACGTTSIVRTRNDGLSAYGKVLYSADSRFISYQRPESQSWLDRRERHVIAWCQSADRVYLDQRAKPFNKLLFDPLRDRGIVMVHAGLVARDGVGVLIPGRSGSGKSTSTLSCLTAGFDILGDDYIGLEERPDGTFHGHSLFASLVMDPHHLKRFDSAVKGAPQRTSHAHELKSFLLLSRGAAPHLAVTADVRLVLVPRIVDAPVTRYRPASKIEALLAVAPPSLLSMPRPRLSDFDTLVRFVERTPTFWLELGRDLASIPTAVDDALAREAGL